MTTPHDAQDQGSSPFSDAQRRQDAMAAELDTINRLRGLDLTARTGRFADRYPARPDDKKGVEQKDHEANARSLLGEARKYELIQDGDIPNGLADIQGADLYAAVRKAAKNGVDRSNALQADIGEIREWMQDVLDVGPLHPEHPQFRPQPPPGQPGDPESLDDALGDRSLSASGHLEEPPPPPPADAYPGDGEHGSPSSSPEKPPEVRGQDQAPGITERGQGNPEPAPAPQHHMHAVLGEEDIKNARECMALLAGTLEVEGNGRGRPGPGIADMQDAFSQRYLKSAREQAAKIGIEGADDLSGRDLLREFNLWEARRGGDKFIGFPAVAAQAPEAHGQRGPGNIAWDEFKNSIKNSISSLAGWAKKHPIAAGAGAVAIGSAAVLAAVFAPPAAIAIGGLAAASAGAVVGKGIYDARAPLKELAKNSFGKFSSGIKSLFGGPRPSRNIGQETQPEPAPGPVQPAARVGPQQPVQQPVAVEQSTERAVRPPAPLAQPQRLQKPAPDQKDMERETPSKRQEMPLSTGDRLAASLERLEDLQPNVSLPKPNPSPRRSQPSVEHEQQRHGNPGLS
ncbi:hypothetical protein [Kitasatospora sp. GAS1066B]|uniref:hypothetical protein n=1 Tax=Kitasatospora sp. GAS1066B TaxID=3156271 RepID=UPI0035114FBE